ncbi:transketolase C-terminal domain-containing protein [Desulforhabdus amnigena]|jgi:pyruvate ferredoxin oxidoreductase alpha subunit|uniref:2-ketoisovalerate ferredoxin oxidoreductase subunit alpha n=1 Tax=Desulforhabdus amnigena TaxID=40218 RepID=A0A9W6FUZ5_9BACT|nr:transketolase C-terminal domain-containing protein [Desulforhabdus amnigena]NLJ29803.1 pyruvate ferredoxin oxidoreductase [Deltaproteobacteria bacterium]GLI35343.1 2-ketoisovalerate ferredoxin oxidoreductase subunit alpha [Desulforhabdus amnigena]
MGKRIGVEVSIAAAEAVALANVDVIAAYPITPQTHIVEHLSELVADGHLDAEFIPVESEHSAMSCCIGSSAAGARTFTATSSQGYALMSEICYIASSMRLPIVMTVANRALSAPISIWNDHADLMMSRDTGWIQTIAENGQEVIDLTFHAFKVAEDHRVLLPVQVNLDGFTLSHMIEPMNMPDKAEVDAYLPPYKPVLRLDPSKPVTFGPVGMPDIYTEAKMAQDQALRNSKAVIIEAWKEFGDKFGRYYKPVETYKTEDAETIIISMGSISETAMTAVDHLRSQGKKVGLARIRLWRPFPGPELFDAVKGAKNLVVLDRAMNFSGGDSGIVAAEVKSILFDQNHHPNVRNFFVGLGGRDVTVQNFEEMVEKASTNGGKPVPYEIINVRE